MGEGAAARTLFSGLTLVMKPGDRIGIVGRNGAGKTTLIRTILGELAPDEGTVVVGQNTRPAYLEQSRSELVRREHGPRGGRATATTTSSSRTDGSTSSRSCR